MISEQVGLILRRSVDVDRPISEFGMDSLGNLELRTHIESEVKIRVTTTDITTVRGLADHLYEQLTSKATQQHLYEVERPSAAAWQSAEIEEEA